MAICHQVQLQVGPWRALSLIPGDDCRLLLSLDLLAHHLPAQTQEVTAHAAAPQGKSNKLPLFSAAFHHWRHPDTHASFLPLHHQGQDALPCGSGTILLQCSGSLPSPQPCSVTGHNSPAFSSDWIELVHESVAANQPSLLSGGFSRCRELFSRKTRICHPVFLP